MEHDIKTIKDILDCVDENNIDNFLIDFSDWLRYRTILKKLVKNKDIEKVYNVEMENVMRWIDDGKFERTIKIEIK